METKRTSFGTAGLVVGIIGVSLSFIPIINNAAFILGILAVIFGIITFIKKGSTGKAIIALICGILAVVITLAAQASAAKALDDLGKSLDDALGDHTEEILGTSVDVSFGILTVEGDYFQTAKLPVTVKNLTDEKKSFSIKIEAVDGSGNRIDDDMIFVSDLGAGQSQTKDAFTLVMDETLEKLKTAKFRVVEISMY